MRGGGSHAEDWMDDNLGGWRCGVLDGGRLETKGRECRSRECCGGGRERRRELDLFNSNKSSYHRVVAKSAFGSLLGFLSSPSVIR